VGNGEASGPEGGSRQSYRGLRHGGAVQSHHEPIELGQVEGQGEVVEAGIRVKKLKQEADFPELRDREFGSGELRVEVALAGVTAAKEFLAVTPAVLIEIRISIGSISLKAMEVLPPVREAISIGVGAVSLDEKIEAIHVGPVGEAKAVEFRASVRESSRLPIDLNGCDLEVRGGLPDR